VNATAVGANNDDSKKGKEEEKRESTSTPPRTFQVAYGFNSLVNR